ncbi:MAG: tetratricopeptide repeat protein [Deltaproteobacteria bacterium]|nr:tetratricopeptide repeat protein [Deltaproteobacteria bacterium]
MKTELESLLDQTENALNEKDLEKAEGLIVAALQKNKNSARGYYLLGQLYYEKGKFSHAISAYKKALVLNPQFVDASISLSVLYNDLGQYEEGGMIFNRALRAVETHEQGSDPYINEKLAQKHLELGNLYLKYLRYDEALSEFSKATQLDKKQTYARLKQAHTLHKKGEKLKALEELKNLKKEAPEFLSGRIALGVLQYSLGHVIDAVEEWELVLQKDPQNEKALAYLKMARNTSSTVL